jgi:hypothetical protein
LCLSSQQPQQHKIKNIFQLFFLLSIKFHFRFDFIFSIYFQF